MSIAEILSLISTLSFVIAAISFVLAAFFWFIFKIPEVIGDLSGRTARKSIARMRADNERAGGQGYKPSFANAHRGKLTDAMTASRKGTGGAQKKSDGMPETGLLTANKAVTATNQQTEVLDGAESTALLVDENATVPLHEEPEVERSRTSGKKLKMLDEVILIHTNEVIS